ncbi:hypothetical protein [Haliangium sp.]|uniref:hypothetical protein n=1 Tax=Haliangium sp. TaxID=2663208 RepID=UPI003D110B84
MAKIDFEVKSYTYSVYTQADSGLVWDNHHIKVRGLLICEGEDGMRAVIYGVTEQSYLPINRYQEQTKRVFLFARERQFDWFRDMLRHEQPVRCVADTGHSGWFSLTTGAEPVGEEES